MVQPSGWAKEPVPLFQWYSNQTGLEDLSNGLVCRWVPVLHFHLYFTGKTLSGAFCTLYLVVPVLNRPTLSQYSRCRVIGGTIKWTLICTLTELSALDMFACHMGSLKIGTTVLISIVHIQKINRYPMGGEIAQLVNALGWWQGYKSYHCDNV